MSRVLAIATVVFLSSAGMLAQSPAARPAFEVSTIKPSLPDARGFSFQLRGSRFLAHNHTLRECIAYAYNLTPRLISVGPPWIDAERFDIVGAAAGDNQLRIDRALPMFQTLLEDRFQLKFHREEQQLPVYNLVLGKGELKLTENTTGPDAPKGLIMRPSAPRVLMLPAHNATIAGFISILQRLVLDRPVIDKTGLTGRYDFTLEWRIDGTLADRGPAGAPVVDTSDKPDIFTAIRGLGLRLEPAKGPVEVMVIDHAEKPNAN